MSTTYSITESFGENLAVILSDKILGVYKKFEKERFVYDVREKCVAKTYTQRVELIADELRNYLPQEYKKAVGILLKILGPENENETGMFTNYYWLLPVGKFVEKYGLADFDLSMQAIQEITKRNTGEYAIRPYIRQYPRRTLAVMKKWAADKNFHLRRLASEGLRPKLPWAPKLDTFVDDPKPVFEILELLKEDDVKFVKKSVANHLRDYRKVNKKEADKILARWSKSKNENTKWIIKHATRK